MSNLPKNVSSETMQLVTPGQTFEYEVDASNEFAGLEDSARWAQMRSQVMHQAVLAGARDTAGWKFQLVVKS